MGELVVPGQWLCLPRFGETGRGASWVRESSVRGGSGIRRPLKLGRGKDTVLCPVPAGTVPEHGGVWDTLGE